MLFPSWFWYIFVVFAFGTTPFDLKWCATFSGHTSILRLLSTLPRNRKTGYVVILSDGVISWHRTRHKKSRYKPKNKQKISGFLPKLRLYLQALPDFILWVRSYLKVTPQFLDRMSDASARNWLSDFLSDVRIFG